MVYTFGGFAHGNGAQGAALALSGSRSPYAGRLRVVEQGALADLLLVDGDPLADPNFVAEPKKFVVIMKDGKIYKNTLSHESFTTRSNADHS